jgi:hypothetical protein
MPAAHINPLAASVAPAMKSAVSNRVSVQSLRILHLNRWTTFRSRVPSIVLLEATLWRQIGGNVRARRSPPKATWCRGGAEMPSPVSLH